VVVLGGEWASVSPAHEAFAVRPGVFAVQRKNRFPEERPEFLQQFAISRSFFISIGRPQAHRDSLWSRLGNGTNNAKNRSLTRIFHRLPVQKPPFLA